MYDQIKVSKINPFTHPVKLFMLGMLIGFIISSLISTAPVFNLSSEKYLIDCKNKTALIETQDRSRNGIANGCNTILNN